ncbi:hypothetical protein ACFY2H_36580 [Streptomyces griseofuscus]|uniref:hypothetical protein n=1 Tax=Streptomyces TaxID=1883 RepID=UPI001602D31C|nr:hypothetical protein [Streptomyces murinus]MBA9050338.1 hypothetical protein [Streptomyces murinus]
MRAQHRYRIAVDSRSRQDFFRIRASASFFHAPRSRRAVLAAGDSTTDVTFVGGATGLRLAINRQSSELMRAAYDDADGRLFINRFSSSR